LAYGTLILAPLLYAVTENAVSADVTVSAADTFGVKSGNVIIANSTDNIIAVILIILVIFLFDIAVNSLDMAASVYLYMK
jgi:type IV secretory pathway VirB3-like protein